MNIIGAISTHHRRYKKHAFVVTDESVLFLEIVRIGLEQTHNFAIPIFVDNGGLSLEQRAAVLNEFNNCEGARILLASRATAGQGLNIQSAQALIQCGP